MTCGIYAIVNKLNGKRYVGEKVSLLKTQYCIVQKTKDGQLIKVWDSMSDVIMANPDYFRIAIYNCCNGYKKSYRGYTWEKLRKI